MGKLEKWWFYNKTSLEISKYKEKKNHKLRRISTLQYKDTRISCESSHSAAYLRDFVPKSTCHPIPRAHEVYFNESYDTERQSHRRTLRTSMGTCVAGGRLAGTLTLMAGVWLTGTLCCMNWAACCFCCCSRRSCSCICSRMSCCRSRIREVMLEELKGGLEAPGCSELLWEEQRETAQLLPAPSSLRVCRTVLGQGAESAGLRGTAQWGARSRPTAGT